MTIIMETETVRPTGAAIATTSPAAHFATNVKWRMVTRENPTLASLKARLKASDHALATAKANAMKIIGRPHL